MALFCDISIPGGSTFPRASVINHAMTGGLYLGNIHYGPKIFTINKYYVSFKSSYGSVGRSMLQAYDPGVSLHCMKNRCLLKFGYWCPESTWSSQGKKSDQIILWSKLQNLSVCHLLCGLTYVEVNNKVIGQAGDLCWTELSHSCFS